MRPWGGLLAMTTAACSLIAPLDGLTGGDAGNDAGDYGGNDAGGDDAATPDASGASDGDRGDAGGGAPPDGGDGGSMTQADSPAETGSGTPDGVAPSPIAYVQGSILSAGKTAKATAQFGQPVKAHDAIVVAIGFDAPSSATVTDSLGNSFHVVATDSNALGTSGTMSVAIAEDVVGGPDAISVSLTTSTSSYFNVELHEYAGLALSNAFDGSASASGSSMAIDGMASGVVMTATPGELVFGFGMATGVMAAGTGFAARSNGNQLTEDMLAGAPGPYRATATMINGTSWTMLAATFKPQ